LHLKYGCRSLFRVRAKAEYVHLLGRVCVGGGIHAPKAKGVLGVLLDERD
jgi:hypothetical protein